MTLDPSIRSFFEQFFLSLIDNAFAIFSLIVFLSFSLLVMSYAKRKLFAFFQLRIGPSYTGPFGTLQPIADVLKLLSKKNQKQHAPSLLSIAPLISFTTMLTAFSMIPFSCCYGVANINPSLLFIFALTLISFYSDFFALSRTQTRVRSFTFSKNLTHYISYSITFFLILIIIAMLSKSFNITKVVFAQKESFYVFYHFPLLIIFFISSLILTKLSPFCYDGLNSKINNTESYYSSFSLLLFKGSKYLMMLLLCSLMSLLFLGGWLSPIGSPLFSFIPDIVWMIIKISCLFFIMIWVHATLPQYRYDQMLKVAWKVLLPFTLFWFIGAANLLYFLKIRG
jgi:NADH-quinone oxidoreductase subunit H